MRTIIFVIALFLIPSLGHASSCGPKVSLSGDQGISGDRESSSVGIKLSWNLFGYQDCKEQEAAEALEAINDAREAEADAEAEELRNLERILRLCRQYGADHPLLEGKCGGN